MKSNINIVISIPSQTRYLRMISRIGESVAEEIDCSEAGREKLSNLLAIVLTEGLVNAIKHASMSDPDKKILVKITVAKNALIVKIHDKGCGFDLNAIPLPCFASSGMEDKGRGIFILRSLMDTVIYTRCEGGNILEMRKKLA